MSNPAWREARQAQPLFAGLASGFKVRKRQTLSQWAEENMVLPPENSASPGPYRIGDAAYQRGMLDIITDPDVEQVVYLTSSQVGKTNALTAAQMYYVEAEPSPQLSVFPTQIVADAYSTTMFDTTVSESPTVADLMDGYQFPGGHISFVGANNPSQLAMRPIRVVTGDEVDRWPLSSGKEGSPEDLADKRTTTFRNKKKIFASTPLLLKTSAIVAMFLKCRQFYFHLVCPDCEMKQVLKWDNVHFKAGEEEKATYHCEGCGSGWTDQVKRRLVRDAEKMGGGWICLSEAPFRAFKQTSRPLRTHVGLWVNELYSSWSSLAAMALAWSQAQGNPEKEQTFQNTRLGLPWEGSVSNSADAEALAQRREVYSPKIVPANAGLITASVDVQDDRFEILTQAWGVGDESWLLEHIKLSLDPSVPASWGTLAETLMRRYPHPGGKRVLRAEAICIDSGGHFTQSVYKFCARNQQLGRRWLPIKGMAGEGRLIMAESKQKLRDGVKLHLVGVDDAKATIYTRFGITAPGPAFIHMHEGFNEDHLKQMTAEHAVVEYNKDGFPARHWEKKAGARNEMLDLLVYNLAARNVVNIDMVNRLALLNEVQIDKLDPEQIGALYRN